MQRSLLSFGITTSSSRKRPRKEDNYTKNLSGRMKPVRSGAVAKGKRKLSITVVDIAPSPETIAGRRTRSTCNADNAYASRSTRSTQNNAFFELPYNYGSRKQVQDDSEASPQRKNKLPSASSDSPSPEKMMSSSVSEPPVKKWRRSSARLSGAPPVQNINANGDAHEIESTTADISKNGVESNMKEIKCEHSKKMISSSCQNLTSTNGQHNLTNKKDNSITKQELKFQKKNCSDALSVFPASKTDNDVNILSTNGTSNIHSSIVNHKATYEGKNNLKRKRYNSEDISSSSCRIRRLSQRGEMASVVEFFFNNKKMTPARSSTKVSLQNGVKNAVLTNSSNNNAMIKLSDSESSSVSVAHTEKTLSDKNEVMANESPMHKKNSTKNLSISKKRKVRSSEVSSSKESNDSENFNGSNDQKGDDTPHTGCQKLSDAVNSTEDTKTTNVPSLTDQEQVDKSVERKNRSLRSSGIKCQPDFYALSLDLMIHRSKKSKSELADNENKPKDNSSTRLQVMSDSEVECSRKSKFETTSKLNTTSPEEDSTKKSLSLSQCTESSRESKPVEMKTSISEQSPLLSSILPVANNSDCDSVNLSPTSGSVRNKGGTKSKHGARNESAKKLDSRNHKVAVNLQLNGQSSTDMFEPPPLFDEEPPSGPEVYYFESDHVALKHNEDYHAVLRAASLLEAQRRYALSELDVLQSQLNDALADPIAFVDKLQRKESINLPSKRSVVSIPTIDWAKYTSPFGTFDNVFRDVHDSPPKKPSTRRKIGTPANVVPTPTQTHNKLFRKMRSHSFNKTWTVEEQRKLEELLIKYPQEHIEFNRFRKIAAEFTDRTPLQVQSRVQKYFLKLAKAGMAIPGRMPRLDRIQSTKSRSGGHHRHRTHHQASLTRISTFFSDFHIPVKMKDDEDDRDTISPSNMDDDDGGWEAVKCEEVSDDEDIPADLRFSDEYLEIIRLKRRRRQQLRLFDNKGQQVIAQHFGYQCDSCECEPIQGVRYHCIDCPPDESVDICQSCIRNQNKFETEIHKTNHRMEPVYANVADDKRNENNVSMTSPYTDVDYTTVASSSREEYNYLDPNFLPQSG